MAVLAEWMLQITGDNSDAMAKLKDTEQATKKSGERLKASLQTMASVGGAAVGTALTGAIATSIGREKVTDKLNAQLAASPADAKKYGDVAGQVYANAYGESMADVSVAIKGVVQNIGGMKTASNQDLQAVTEKVMDLSSAFDQDLGGTTQAVGDLLKNGLAKDATEALDIIASGFASGADKRGDYLDTITEYGTQFKKLGIDGKVATGMLSQGLQAGARDSDFLADALKEFSIRAIDGSKASSDAYKALGLDAQKMTAQMAAGGPQAAAGLQTVLEKLRGMKDPVAQSAAAVGLFGTKAEDLGASLYALDPSTAVQALGDVGGAAAKVGETLNENTATQIEGWKRKFTQAGQDVVGALGPVGAAAAAAASFAPGAIQMAGGLGQVSTALKGANFGAFLTGMGAASKAFVANKLFALQYYTVVAAGALRAGAANVAAGAVTVGTLVAQKVAMVAMAATTAVVRGAVMAWTAMQWLLNAALTANPIGIVVVAIAALVAAVIYAYNNFEWFRNIVQAVGAAFVQVWDWIVTGAKWVFNTILVPYFKVWWTVVSTVFKAVWAVVSWVWERIKVGFTATWNVLKGGVAWLKNAWSGLKTVLISPLQKLWAFVKELPGKIGSAFKSLVNILTFPFRTAFNLIARLFNSTLGQLSFSLPDWIPGIGGKGFSMPKIPEIPALAEGGIVSRPTLALIGEAGPEAVVPLSRGRGAGVGVGGGSVTVNVHVAGDGDVVSIRRAVEEAWEAKERAARRSSLQATAFAH